MSNYYIYNGELYSANELAHYGVPGMKWGHRKALPEYQRMQQAKARKKSSK